MFVFSHYILSINFFENGHVLPFALNKLALDQSSYVTTY